MDAKKHCPHGTKLVRRGFTTNTSKGNPQQTFLQPITVYRNAPDVLSQPHQAHSIPRANTRPGMYERKGEHTQARRHVMHCPYGLHGCFLVTSGETMARESIRACHRSL